MSFSETERRVRLLLMLWCLGGVEAPVMRGELMRRVKVGKERSADFVAIVEGLVTDGAIEVVSRYQLRLLRSGVERLRVELLDPMFEFGGVVLGKRFVSPLLRFVREVVAGSVVAEVEVVEKIEDFETFKSILLDTYQALISRFNYDRLVPIYQIRREIGDRVDREQFNQWIIKIQVDGSLEMMDCGERKTTPDQIADSVQPPLGRLWFFAAQRRKYN